MEGRDLGGGGGRRVPWSRIPRSMLLCGPAHEDVSGGEWMEHRHDGDVADGEPPEDGDEEEVGEWRSKRMAPGDMGGTFSPAW